MKTRIIAKFFLPVIFASVVIVQAATTQRDHLTPQEVDLVKEAQILDKRIEIFTKAIDRRLQVLTGHAPPSTKQSKKEAELWGDLPTGSRSELVGDIARIFDEAITNIDDVSSRDDRNPLIPKALRKLAQEVNIALAQLTPLKDQAKSEAEIANFELMNENAQQIREAASRLPPDVEIDKKGKKKKDSGG